MKDVSEFSKLQYGQVIKVTGITTVVGGRFDYYCIFLGFLASGHLDRILAMLYEVMKCEKGKEHDIYQLLSTHSYSFIPKAILIGACKSMPESKLDKLIDIQLSYPLTESDVISIRSDSGIDNIITITDKRVPKEVLDTYITRSILTGFKMPDLVSIDFLYKELGKKYDEAFKKEYAINTTTKTTSYKPLHFYLYMTEKVYRLYYCVCETKTKGEYCFLLMYNGKATDMLKETRVETILKNSRNRRFLTLKPKKHYRVMSDEALYDLGVEAVPQYLDYSDYIYLTDHGYYGKEANKYAKF